MEKHINKTSDGLVVLERDQKSTNAHTGCLVALSCGASIWLCGTGLGTIGLAMQERSHNNLLRYLQDVCLLHIFFPVICLRDRLWLVQYSSRPALPWLEA